MAAAAGVCGASKPAKKRARRDWARQSREARARRKSAALELQESARELEARLKRLRRLQEQREDGPEPEKEAERQCKRQKRERRVQELRNEELRAEVGELLADTARAKALFAKNNRLLQELTGQSGHHDAPPLAYHPDEDDQVFLRLEERHLKQLYFVDDALAVAEAGGERAQVVVDESGDCGPEPRIEAVMDRLAPFPRDVIAVGIQQFSMRYTCVCRTQPVEPTSTSPGCGTRWWAKTRYWLRDGKTGACLTLVVRGVLSFVRERNRSLLLWTALSGVEPDYTHSQLPLLETDEQAWGVLVPVIKDGVTRVRVRHQVSVRASDSPNSPRALANLVLSGMQEMLHEAHQGMENSWCDEMRRQQQ